VNVTCVYVLVGRRGRIGVRVRGVGIHGACVCAM
jgi:hypothetical protein